MQRFPHTLLINALLLGSTVFLTSCPPEDPPNPDPIIFSISSPQNGQVIQAGDTVHFRGFIDPHYIGFTYRIRVVHLNSNSILYNFEAEETSQYAHFDQKWVNPVADSTQLEVEFSASRQGYGNTEASRLTLQVVP